MQQVSEDKVMQWKHAIGQQLQLERKRLGLSQGDLKERLGLSQKTISDIETGKTPTFDHFLRYCELLELDFAVMAARARVYMRATDEDPAAQLLR